MMGMTLTKGCAIDLLDGLAGQVVGSTKELVEASSEVQGRAGQVTTSLTGEESMSLHTRLRIRKAASGKPQQYAYNLLHALT